jgi:hypothetical protein
MLSCMLHNETPSISLKLLAFHFPILAQIAGLAQGDEAIP